MDLLMRQLLQHKHSSAITERPFSSVLAQALLLFLMLIGVSLSRGAAADILAELNPEQQLRVARVCAPMQFDQGASAYRRCVLDQIAAAVQNQQPEATPLSALSLDEGFAIQQVCDSKRLDSPADVSRCTQQQIEQLEQEPESELSILSKDEQHIITTQCFGTFSAAAARDYRVCVNNAISSLDTLPAADYTEQSAGTRSNIQLECSINATNVSGYRKCLLSTLGIAFTDTSIADTTPIDNTIEEAVANDTDQQNTVDAGVATQAIEAQEADQSGEPAVALDDASAVQASQSPGAKEAIEPVDIIQSAESVAPALSSDAEAQTSLGDPPLAQIDENVRVTQESPANLSTSANSLNMSAASEGNTGISPQLKLVAIVAAVSIPLMLLGIRYARQADKYELQSTTATPAQSDEKTLSFQQPPPARPDLRPISSTSQLPDKTLFSLSDTAAIEAEMDETFQQTLASSKQQTPVAGKQKAAQENLSADSGTDPATMRIDHADCGQFAAWLKHWPAQRQQEHAIELLVYWMAYADNRYDPALKKKIFLMKDPDAHSLIKRWVFRNDATAFADAVKHLQLNTDLEQRKQVIDLLMALLVNENALTPNQNVLLRFLADAFGIGGAELEMQFMQAFGQSMHAIPRPDKTIWWKSREAEQKLRWDVHAIARQPEQVRCRIVLGQPLGGPLNLQSVKRSYAMAISRCNHKRANRLGERERMLLSMQRQKFMAAHNTLLEPVE